MRCDLLDYFGLQVRLPDGSLNPEIGKYCEVTTIEQRPGQPIRLEMEIRHPVNTREYYNKQATLILGKTENEKQTNKKKTHRERDLVERVVHNPPATIVFWKDKTKTVVKQQDGDEYDPEKGFMAACTKKLFGNDNQFNYEIKWYVPKQEQVKINPADPPTETINDEDAEQIVEETPEADVVLKEFANVMFGGADYGTVGEDFNSQC